MAFQPGQSGNPAGRPKGSVNKNLSMLRDAVEKVLPLVVDRALAGDAEAQKLILERGLPKLKPVDTPDNFTIPEGSTHEQAQAIIMQAAGGELTVAKARELITELLPALKAPAQSRPMLQSTFSNAYLCGLYEHTEGEG